MLFLGNGKIRRCRNASRDLGKVFWAVRRQASGNAAAGPADMAVAPPRLFRAALMRGPFTLLSKKMFRHEEKIMGIGIGGRITNPSVQNMHRPCHLRARWEKLWH